MPSFQHYIALGDSISIVPDSLPNRRRERVARALDEWCRHQKGAGIQPYSIDFL